MRFLFLSYTENYKLNNSSKTEYNFISGHDTKNEFTETVIVNQEDAYYDAEKELIKHADETDCFNFIVNDIKDVSQDRELVIMSKNRLKIKTVYLNSQGVVWDLYEERDTWEEIDNLVLTFQKKIKPDATPAEILRAEDAGTALLDRFYPLLKKYLVVLTTGQINFKNYEQRQFIRLFTNAPYQLKALSSKKNIRRSIRDEITRNFNFIVESYGKQDQDIILSDLRMLFMILANRYKNKGKSFCCYVYNAFRFEVARHIKAYLKNPAHFHYKMAMLKEDESTDEITDFENSYEEMEERNETENLFGTPNLSWIAGITCSDTFRCLTACERKIIVKYYAENWTDAQIGDIMGMHINTANLRRKEAVAKIAKQLGFSTDDIVRRRQTENKRKHGDYLL